MAEEKRRAPGEGAAQTGREQAALGARGPASDRASGEQRLPAGQRKVSGRAPMDPARGAL